VTLMAQWVTCQPGQWTLVSSNLPSPFGFAYVWSRDGKVDVNLRRYMDSPPFYWQDSTTLDPGKNVRPAAPAFFNSWWFNPTSRPAVLRVT
jgi:hypothetical protein